MNLDQLIREADQKQGGGLTAEYRPQKVDPDGVRVHMVGGSRAEDTRAANERELREITEMTLATPGQKVLIEEEGDEFDDEELLRILDEMMKE